MNNSMPTSVSQDRSCANSTQSTINQRQQQIIQVTHGRTQKRQHDTTLLSSNTTPQDEDLMSEQDGSRKEKSKPRVRATTIDEFLKENRIDVEIDGLSSELSDDVGDSFPLDENYYSHVMEDIDDDEGTIGRNKRFVSLLYTSWHAVTPKAKKFMWNYVNEGAYNTVDIIQTKFILPDSGEKWVIQAIRDAWKRFKGKIKQKHFVPFDTIEDMSISEKNKKHKEQQKFPHRMGPINFGRVRVALRATKETNEEPKRFEMFLATRTSQKRKEVDQETQDAIDEFQNRQAAGEIDEESFKSLFGKEQPGRVRCYGRSITRRDLKKHAEISELKQQHQEEVTSLKAELGDMKAKQQHQEADLYGLRNMIKLLVQRSEPGMRPEEIEALLQDAQHSPIDANSAHGSTHIPNINMDNSEYANED
ncbi:uncharacterized protein LOC130962898 [Arachis stenosperma]|uniref:uncharacterized protein LOC130962898 n=1 Tax=Arachis stenosperma TaxID=217475 RepID=UPI0025AD62CF|nr:uncharacterized protein LOC130962898 [Arachis stenosperma]